MKVAVSVPDRIFEAAERLARQRSVPRSQIFAEALASYLEVCGPEAITAKLNEVYEQEDSGLERGLAQAQASSVPDEAW